MRRFLLPKVAAESSQPENSVARSPDPVNPLITKHRSKVVGEVSAFGLLIDSIGMRGGRARSGVLHTDQWEPWLEIQA
jgi:hypothetical protein